MLKRYHDLNMDIRLSRRLYKIKQTLSLENIVNFNENIISTCILNNNIQKTTIYYQKNKCIFYS